MSNFFLNSINKEEGKYYIDTKLKAARLKQDIISSKTYSQILNFSNWTIRMINQDMDKTFYFL